jgi:hypothetical protein
MAVVELEQSQTPVMYGTGEINEAPWSGPSSNS